MTGNRVLQITLFSAGLLTVLLGPLHRVSADEFFLHGGGRVEGRWENRRTRDTSFEVVTEKGIRIRLPKNSVHRRNLQRESYSEYQRISPTFKDSIKQQWAIAEWCREHRLPDQRAKHLRRILELDADHFGARKGLGYVFIEGRWTTREDFRKKRGYQRNRGRWVAAQELKLDDEKAQVDEAQREWFAKLRRWRMNLAKDRVSVATSEIQRIRDPMAIKALQHFLQRERVAELRILYIDILGEIGGNAARKILINHSLQDPNQEVFFRCLEFLSKEKHPDSTDAYVQALRDANNAKVNRAGTALRILGDNSAISALIDGLVTTHKIELANKRRSDTMTSTFARQVDPSGIGGADAGFNFSAGGKPKAVYYRVQNPEVLNALVKLSGGASYGFDQKAWKFWHAIEQRRLTQH